MNRATIDPRHTEARVYNDDGTVATPEQQREAEEHVARLMSETNKLRARLFATGTVFQRTDRILTGAYDLSVRVIVPDSEEFLLLPEKLASTLGWTDGESIILNPGAARGKQSNRLTAVLYGTNLHELAHTIFSPRIDEAIVERVSAYGSHAFETLNALEDQRAESLFVSLYEPAGTHLAEMCLGYIVERENEATPDTAALLIWGRKYLPRSLRLAAREIFERQYAATIPNHARLFEIIDEYRTLAYPRDEARMESLVLEFLSILNDDDAAMNDFSEAVSHQTSHEQLEHGLSDDEMNESASDSVEEESDEEDESEEDEEESGSGDSDADDDDEGDSEGDSDSEESDETSDDEDSAESGSEGSDDEQTEEQSTSQDDSEEPGTSDSVRSDSGGEDDSEPFDMNAVLDDAREQSDANVGDIQDAIEHETVNARFSENVPADEVPGTAVYPTPTDVVSARRVSDLLRRVRLDTEAGWDQRQSQGRFNARAHMNAAHGDFDVFDQWNPGAEDTTDVELVILLDMSSSMTYPAVSNVDFYGINSEKLVLNGYSRNRAAQQTVTNYKNSDGEHVDSRAHAAARSLWALRTGAHRVEGVDVTVIGFTADRESKLLARSFDAPSRETIPVPASWGGTVPTYALRDARDLLLRSRKSLKVVVILTDGDWQRHESAETIIKGLQRRGVIVALFGIGEEIVKKRGSHGCSPAVDLDSPSDVAAATSALVSDLVKRAAGLSS